MEAGAATVLFQYGLAGVVILGLTIVVRQLYADNQRLHGIIQQLQENRRIDAQETVEKVTQPLGGISQTLALIYDKIVVSKKNGGGQG